MSGTNRNMRIGSGEYDVGGISSAQAGTIALEAAAQVEPAILETLYKECYPLFNKIYFNNKPIIDWNCADDELKQKIILWSEKHNLNYEWAHEHVFITLCLWQLNEQIEGKYIGGWKVFSTIEVLAPEEKIFTFKVEGWEPAFQTKKEFVDSIKEYFNNYLEEYTNRLEALAEERGYTKTPEARQLGHFKWWALRHIKGMQAKDIIEIEGLTGDESTVNKAINKIEKWLNMTGN